MAKWMEFRRMNRAPSQHRSMFPNRMLLQERKLSFLKLKCGELWLVANVLHTDSSYAQEETAIAWIIVSSFSFTDIFRSCNSSFSFWGRVLEREKGNGKFIEYPDTEIFQTLWIMLISFDAIESQTECIMTNNKK